MVCSQFVSTALKWPKKIKKSVIAGLNLDFNTVRYGRYLFTTVNRQLFC